MAQKPTYKVLEQRVRELENQAAQRALAEEALRKNEERYRSLFENYPVETITVDHEARVTGYNLARQKVGDRLPNIGDVMYKDYATKHAIDMYRELIECIELGVSKEFPAQKYRDRYLYITMSPFHGGAILTSRDMTAGKLAEAALRKNEERYRSLFENYPVETIIVDHETRVTGYNLARQKVNGRLPDIGDVMYKDYAANHCIDMHRELIDCIRRGVSKEFPEQKYKDRYLYLNMAPFDGGAIITSRDITHRKQAEEEREKLIVDLKEALATVKQLSGLLPICSSCKKIRDDEGYWNQIEVYIRDRSEADFSHGICPECARELYPELLKED